MKTSCLVTLLAIPSLASAQPAINWFTIDGGGGTSSAGTITLSGTIGQPDAGPVMTGGTLTLTGGFWAGFGSTGPTCPGTGPGACSRADWNEDGVIDFNDFLAFLNDFNGEDPCADLNSDGIVDFNDFLEYLNIYNAGC